MHHEFISKIWKKKCNHILNLYINKAPINLNNEQKYMHAFNIMIENDYIR